ncbi:methionyl-tRNA formyltransferase [Propionispora vibrioides]|uniref:Methionyl-tRNA formyltransferase n=1 Tax=Propionispora vibrioides TaxID=112903 RepID=A0A1H8NMS8_9FIRM|nr:methionyl-tRNA formyltransferase [Propionispora vibrioides]SEO30876.1 methionyl-tRNA formyltransferase [Propionispora vibrioides]
MTKLRIVFMGTPDFAVPCLETLLSGPHEVVGVVTQPDRPKGRGQKFTASPVKEIALAHSIPVFQPEKIKTEAAVAALRAWNPDLIVVVAFGQLLSPAILKLPPLGCINVHASLLPYYRGAAPIHWVVINGENKSGVTTMYMDEGMDTGDMLLKEEVVIGTEETTGQLYEKLKHVGAALLAKSVQLLTENKAPRISQDHAKATYAPMLSRQTERIDWTCPAEDIHNLVRGLNPWPGSFAFHRGKLVKIWRTQVVDGNFSGQPGRISKINEDSFVVETGKGTLEIYELQPESKRRMNSREYITGYSPVVGEKME